MKRIILTAALFTSPFAVLAQTTIFSDNFANGSTLNAASVPGGTATASKTSYDIASSKAATTGPAIGSGRLKLTLNSATSSGFIEAQALFSTTPVALVSVGDYINLTYVFTNTTGTLISPGTSSFLLHGLYNSGGSAPLAGSLNSSGLSNTTNSPYATGNCANWVGYASRISGGGTSQAYTRPSQATSGTTSGNQDLIGNGFGGGTYTNGGVTFGGNETASFTMSSGSTYTMSYTIALTSATNITVTNNLYSGVGAVAANLIFSQTNVGTAATFLTNSFDGLCIAVRTSGTTTNPVMEISQITIVASTGGGVPPQTISASNSIISVSPAVTNINAYSLVTVTERDIAGNAITNGAVAPVLATSLGTLGGVTAQGGGVYTATLTSTNPGYANVSGTISATAIGIATNASAYFAGTIGTNGTFYVGPGFISGTYNLNFNSAAGQSFSVYSCSNITTARALWTRETDLSASPPSQTMSETAHPGSLSGYSFTVQPPANGQIYYTVRSP